MVKRKSKFNSLSTPGARQDLSNYLVELAFLRSNNGIKLPPKFWRLTKYKFRYMREIKGCRKFIKLYGEEVALHVAQNNYITTWTNYANLEVLFQKRMESFQRKMLPKDTTPVKPQSIYKGEDLRDFSISYRNKKGLFEKLEEIENDKNN